ncbi:diguanylate cyclase domain-containing protein [Acetobacterium bakii]|uniref:diguanylate cyclase domain-containing protein n=1 Tax=Acetobacterium bakii TaxID=52689 RepID=UPI000683673E|nr:diguanylate cyclase [Acetobacterium bakii]
MEKSENKTTSYFKADSSAQHITEANHRERILTIREERYRIILEQTDDILYEWNFTSNKIHYSDQYKQKFGYEPPENSLAPLFISQIIHPEDLSSYNNWVLNTYLSEKKSSLEYRQKKADDTYLWVRIQSSPVFSETGIVYKAVGLIDDIDLEKRRLNALEIKVQLDPLTKLYNKVTTQELIDDYLENNPLNVHALLMIDIDDFKSVNDNLGHIFGDVVLTEISTKIKKLFRAADIVGRIGGDEFVVFLKDIHTKALIKEKAEEICAVFRQTFSGVNKDYSISGSIGIALYNDQGNTFSELYGHADTALYYAKKLGKDQFSFYDEIETMRLNMPLPKRQDTTIDSDETYQHFEIHSYLFNILYQSRDIKISIDLILALIGDRFNVSRCYFLKNAPDDHSFSDIYEWCGQSATPAKEAFHHLSFEHFKAYYNQFNENAIFYCADINALDPDLSLFMESQQIVSTLQVAIIAKNSLKGFIGFDQCDTNRLWTQQEIETISYVGKLIATFLLIIPLVPDQQ